MPPKQRLFNLSLAWGISSITEDRFACLSIVLLCSSLKHWPSYLYIDYNLDTTRSVSPYFQLSGWRLIYRCSFIKHSNFTPNLYSCMSFSFALSSWGRNCSLEVILQLDSPDWIISFLDGLSLLSLSSLPMVPVFLNHFCKQPFYFVTSYRSLSQMILLTIDFLVAASLFQFAPSLITLRVFLWECCLWFLLLPAFVILSPWVPVCMHFKQIPQ